MRKLISLFLLSIIPMPALATATCTTTNEPKACREIPGCTWAKVQGDAPGQYSCQPCGETYYGKGDGTSQNQCVLCSKLSGTVDGKTITGHWDASAAGSAKHECYADCDAKLNAINKNGSTGKWMLGNNEHTIAYGTTDEKKMCKIVCYEEYNNNGYNICNSYYSTKINNNEICTPTWKLVSSNEINPEIAEHYMCNPKTTKTAIMYSFSEYEVYDVCFARECASGYHLVDASDELRNYGIIPEEYSCKFADNTEIPNEKMFQTCESNIRKCSNYFGASCKVTIDGTEYTGGTVKGDAIWNGTNAYTTDGCTCTVSTSVTAGTYEHVCKRSTTSNTWDGTNCETTIESCNSGYCVVGYDANNKTQRCAAAPRGYYSDGRDVKECHKCLAGKTTEKEKSTNKDACSYSRETEFCDNVGCFNLNYTSLQQK